MATNEHGVTNGVVVTHLQGSTTANADLIVEGRTVHRVNTVVGRAWSESSKRFAVDIDPSVFNVTKPKWINKPTGNMKLVFEPGEEPRRFAPNWGLSEQMRRYALHALPITVIWKNKRNLEEVTCARAIYAANRGQLNAWAYTQQILDAALLGGTVEWRRAKEQPVPRQWDAGDIPAGAKVLGYRSVAYGWETTTVGDVKLTASRLNARGVDRFFVVEVPE